MSFQKFHQSIFGALILVLFVLAISGFAQKPTPTPMMVFNQVNRQMPVATGNNLYCAGYVQTASIDTNYKIVGAQNEKDQHIYAQGDLLYVSISAKSGVKVGDMFAVVRPRGRVETRWTNKKNLGFYVQEVGSVEVVAVKREVSVVRVKTSCDNLLLGDLLQPIPDRVSPLFRERPPLDVFGYSVCKTRGRIFLARDGQELLGRETIVYIDLGAEDNVSVGDYLTIFRPLGSGNLFDKTPSESVSARDEGFQSHKYRGGKFSNQASRKAGDKAQGRVVTTEEAKEGRQEDLHQVLGEMVVLNVKERTATAIITRTAAEIHTGDRVELQLK